jgi:diacylglycerol kinase family enzyme
MTPRPRCRRVAGRPIRVDVGRANSRIFVNNVGWASIRSSSASASGASTCWAKWGALAIAAGHVVRDFRPLEGSITADGDRRALAAAAVFIGNNRFSATGRAVGERACLDEGVLDVGIVAAPLGIRGRSQLAWTVAASRKWPGRVVRTAARQVQIDLHEGPRPIAFDGEQDDALATCTVEILPEALRVLVPGAA